MNGGMGIQDQEQSGETVFSDDLVVFWKRYKFVEIFKFVPTFSTAHSSVWMDFKPIKTPFFMKEHAITCLMMPPTAF